MASLTRAAQFSRSSSSSIHDRKDSVMMMSHQQHVPMPHQQQPGGGMAPRFPQQTTLASSGNSSNTRSINNATTTTATQQFLNNNNSNQFNGDRFHSNSHPINNNDNNNNNSANIHQYSQHQQIGNHNNTSTTNDNYIGSLGLSKQRRHAASMSAATIRGSWYHEPVANKTTRSSSWAPDSPKKAKAYKGIALEKEGNLKGFWHKISNIHFLNKKVIRRNKTEILCWAMLVALIIVVYKFFSDGSFSSILTLASAFQCFSLALLNLKVMGQQSIAGVSQRSLILFCICLVFRLVSTLFFNGYLPVDRSGDWVYQLADITSVGLIVSLLMLSRRYCKTTVQNQQDKDTCNIVIPVVIAAVLAVAVHPTLNQWAPADIAWTFALYVETFAMVPQLFMMGKLGGEVEALTSHYVASMAASKVFAFLFWYFSYTELAPRNGLRNIAGWAVITSYSAQTLLFADFLYYYIASLRIGKKMILNF